MKRHMRMVCRLMLGGLLCLSGAACSGGGDGGGSTGAAQLPSGGGGTGGGGTTTAGPATVTISSPAPNAALPTGTPVTVTFATQNFTIGDLGQDRMNIYLDNDPTFYTIINGATNRVYYNGAPAANVEWVSPTSFRFTNLPDGLHTFHVNLVNAIGSELTNGEAGTARAVTVGVPFPSAPSIIPVGPAPNSAVEGPVLVSFVFANHVSGLDGQPHMHAYFDGSTARHEYYNGPGITEDDGVQLNGAHTHAVHWKSPTSFMMYGWPPGSHNVRLVLADAAHNELTNSEATGIISFQITGSTSTSEFILDPVLQGFSGTGMAFTPDGRLFYADGRSGATQNGVAPGAIWIVDTAGGTWTRRPTPFYQTTVGAVGEQGLNGIAIDPNYATNGYVYIYYSVPTGTKDNTNRLIRVKDVNGQATQETIILDGLLGSDQHNGGVLHFGPDGKLYVTVGEATNQFLSQSLTSPNGKILRINSDGSFPGDNPFPGTPIWAYGIRNSFGMTFHPVTNDLWITDNGPTVNDEVNLIVKGGNYGWPLATGSETGQSGNLLPAAYVLSQPVGITNIVALAATNVYETEYHNNLFFTDYVGGKIRRLVLDPSFKTVASSSTVFDGGVGALVPLKQAPDGYLYTSGSDAFYRVTPNPNLGH